MKVLAVEALADVGIARDRRVSLPGVVVSTGTGTNVSDSREICRHTLTNWQRTTSGLASCMSSKKHECLH